MKFSALDEQMMRFALEEARIAFDMGEIPVGAVLARESAVLSRAHNESETLRDPTAHAEMLALRRAGAYKPAGGLTLYVTLEPCPMCAGAIALCGVSRLVYAQKDAQYGCAGSVYRITEDPAFPHYCPADGGLLANESAALLKAFFALVRRGRAGANMKTGKNAYPAAEK